MHRKMGKNANFVEFSSAPPLRSCSYPSPFIKILHFVANLILNNMLNRIQRFLIGVLDIQLNQDGPKNHWTLDFS